MSHPNPQAGGPGAAPRKSRRHALVSAGQFALTAIAVGAVATWGFLIGHGTALKAHPPVRHGAEGAPVAAADVNQMYVSTPELVAKGKALYTTNCSACHGMEGKGDGAAAAALNPKPRNFSSREGWKFGSGTARIVRTVTEGSPGTGMAAFTTIPLGDRLLLAHYVRSLHPGPDEDKPEDKAWLGVGEGAATAGAPTAAAAAPAGPSIPVLLAMRKLAEPVAPPGVAIATPPPAGAGADLYRARCASCHGASGEGGVKVKMLGSAPYAYVTTRSLGDGAGGWASDPAGFERMVIEGFPGTTKVSNGDLSREAVREIHLYTLWLRAQQGAARTGS